MNEGANILKGRNNNQVILDKNGGIATTSGNSLILINSQTPPQSPISTPSSVTSTYSLPNLKSTGSLSLTESKDVIPLYFPTQSTIILTSSLITDTSSFLLPEIEETFNVLFEENQVFTQTDTIGSTDPLINPLASIISGNRNKQENNNTSGTTPLSESETEEILTKILEGLRITPTDGNIIFIKAWRQAEGGRAAFNAFNTILSKPGVTQYNNIGVKNYKSKEDGISANVQSLKESQYNILLQKLKNVKTIQDAYNLAVLESDGPGNGAFYVWSEGYYINRIQECKELAAGTLDRTNPKRAAVIREFNGCPPPKNISNKYIASVLKGWIRLGYTKPSQTKVTAVIYGP
jgi:hypothetical protein